MLSLLQSGVEIHIQRGELDGARRVFSMFSRLEESTDVQERSATWGRAPRCAGPKGDCSDALADGEATIEPARTFGISRRPQAGHRRGAGSGVRAGRVGEARGAARADRGVPPGTRPPYLDAHARRFRARLADDGAGYEAAAGRFRELGIPFWLAVTLLEHGEWLAGQGQASEAEPLLAEASEIFERLAATPWLERARRLASSEAVPV